MTTIYKPLLFSAAMMLAGPCGPVIAQDNANATFQEGRVNINITRQCGESNDNTTHQYGKVNINRTVQHCGNRRNQTAQFGGINSKGTEQGRRYRARNNQARQR